MIAIYEGEYSEGMQYALMANKLCKNILNWEKLLLVSSKLLIKLKKYDDLAGFAHKIYEVLCELTES